MESLLAEDMKWQIAGQSAAEGDYNRYRIPPLLHQLIVDVFDSAVVDRWWPVLSRPS